MTLRLALCFHFDQPLSEHAAMAGRLGYSGLVEVLLRHPGLKANLCLGGPFVHALHWLDPPLLSAFHQGVQRGQFELLGSSYAGNLLAACDEWDNAQQLALHRALMTEEFGPAPTTFGNPGLTWNPGLTPALVAAGYRAVIVADRMLQGAGLALPLVYGVGQGEHTLGLLWSDEALRARFNAAVWFHRPKLLLSGLEALGRHPSAGNMLPVVSLNADSFGLWASEHGMDPRAEWEGLGQVLDWLERQPGLEIIGLNDLGMPDLFVEGMIEGWSAELDRAAAAEPSAEPLADWQDYLRRSPTILQFRRLHRAIRNRLTAIGSSWADPGWVAPPPEQLPEACANLYRSAIRTYCMHQYRFGQPGQGGKGQPEWEGIAATFALARAAEMAGGPLQIGAPVRASIEDVTGDGEDEILLEDHRHLVVLSHFGGRMVYWFDLVDGAQHVGNPWAVPQGRYRTDITLMQEAVPGLDASLPRPWDDPAPQEEPPPGWRASLVPDWLASELGAQVPLWPRPNAPRFVPGRPVRRRALNDFILLDGLPALPADDELDYRLEEGGVTFLRFFGYNLEMTKNVRLTADGLRVNYRFHNAHDQVRHVRLEVVSEIAPDGHLLLSAPSDWLLPVVADGKHPGVRNTHSGTAIIARASRPVASAPTFTAGLLALEMTQRFEFTLGSGKAETLTLRLQVLSEHEQSLVRGGLKPAAGWPPPPMPEGEAA